MVLKGRNYIHILLIMSTTLCSAELNITLTSTHHEDFNTNCDSDLLENDIISFHGNATSNKNISKKIDSGTFDIYLKDDNRPFKRYKFYGLNQDCDEKANISNFICTIHDNLIITHFNITAKEIYSEASVQLNITFNNIEYGSNVRKFPKIYNKSKIKLTLNRQPLTDKITQIQSSDNVTDLELCCGDAPKPCIVTISSKLSIELNMSSECVQYKHKNQDNATYILGYTVCGNANLTAYTVEISRRQTQGFDRKQMTSCSKGLIKDTDRLIFVGEIHLDKPDDRPPVRFDIKPKVDGSSFINRCRVVTKFCVQDNSTCYCYKPDQSNIIKYVFNITADAEYSNGTFKSYFIDSTGKEVNNTFKIPEIIDPAITSLRDVTINGEKVINECNKYYKHGNLSVHAACKDHLLPCTLELFVNGKKEEQGHAIIFDTKYNITTKVKLTIKQNICGYERLTSDVNCVIELNPDHGTNESQDSKDVIIAVCVVIPIIIASIITALYCIAKKRKGKKTQIRTDENEVIEIENIADNNKTQISTELNQAKESKKNLKDDVEDLKDKVKRLLDQPEEEDTLLHQRKELYSRYEKSKEEYEKLQNKIVNLQQKDVAIKKDLSKLKKDLKL